MHSQFNITRNLEEEIVKYTGARYAVCTNSCTMALLLAMKWESRIRSDTNIVILPKRTYVSVPQSAIHAGFSPIFSDEEWIGEYQLKPYPIWDSARRFTSGMYREGHMQCLSFHTSKILGDTQGGCIIHDNDEADAWFRRARFDGRTEGVAPKDDGFDMIAFHCYISPDVSARLLAKLSVLPKHNDDLPNDPYPDLSKHDIFTRS